MKTIIAFTKGLSDELFIADMNSIDWEVTEFVLDGNSKNELAISYAERENIPFKLFIPDFERYGMPGLLINFKEMVRYAEGMVAVVHRMDSRRMTLVNIFKKHHGENNLSFRLIKEP